MRGSGYVKNASLNFLLPLKRRFLKREEQLGSHSDESLAERVRAGKGGGVRGRESAYSREQRELQDGGGVAVEKMGKPSKKSETKKC